MKNKRDLEHRLQGFKALVEDLKHTSSFMEEVDGSFRIWRELSHEAKLQYLARDAVSYDVPFEPFAKAVRDALTGSTPAVREEAALRLLLRSVRELHGLERLLPDDGRLEPQPVLTERLQDLLGKQSIAGPNPDIQPKQPGRAASQDKDMER